MASLLLDELDKKEAQKKKYRITQEVLSVNGKNIIQRDNQTIHFNNQILPKLSPFQNSILNEEDIAPVQESFNQIKSNDYSNTKLV
ncbi:hypothetical protein [Cylindrospermum stagnale]|uniref:hypothetical protein n=1 Tax=Cylindrospermum stagnale TaxID=142864 RepID=UPI0002FD8A6D|nr:hypothetical protein [Cylindrospermum stagnale]